MNIERERLRNAFRLIEDDDENCHLKDYLISISTQKTQYQNLNAIVPNDRRKDSVKRLSIINAMLNKKYLTRKYKKRTDRIVFYSFLEKSLNKSLLHTHMIMRVPKFLLSKLKEFFIYLRNILVRKFYYSLRITRRPEIATKYMSKHFRDNNDNFFVF